MTEQFANFAQSSLSTSIDDEQTTIYIPSEDQSLFPSQGNFRIVVQSFDASGLTPISKPEIMLVTAVGGNGTFTVQRGAESTTPLAFRSGAKVSHVVTAGVMQALESASIKTWSPFIGTPSNMTVPILSYSPFSMTLAQIFNLHTASGTITLTIQINGVNVTGLANLSVTSTPQSPTATGANTVHVGDRITMVLSSNSSASNLEFTLKGTL